MNTIVKQFLGLNAFAGFTEKAQTGKGKLSELPIITLFKRLIIKPAGKPCECCYCRNQRYVENMKALRHRQHFPEQYSEATDNHEPH